jgi:hypothetical protein
LPYNAGITGKMKLQIMIGFIAMFATISFFIPTPMFPGSYVVGTVGKVVQVVQDYSQILSSLFNGLFFGGIMGLIFFGAARKIKT